MKKTLQCIYDIYKYNLIKEVASYVNYKKRLIENKPDFVAEWDDSEFKTNTSHPQINQDNPYNEKTHKLNYRISEMFRNNITEDLISDTALESYEKYSIGEEID